MATIKQNAPQERVRPTKPVTAAKPAPEASDDADDTAEEEALEDAEETGDTEQQDDSPEEAADDAGDAEDGAEEGEEAAQQAAQPQTPAAKAAAPASAKTPASGPQKPPTQAGFAQRAGRTSTAPIPQSVMKRPYLESPRAFGIHIKGHLVRFKQGRTPITDNHFRHHELTAADVLKALKTDAYVADNGAELVEDKPAK